MVWRAAHAKPSYTPLFKMLLKTIILAGCLFLIGGFGSIRIPHGRLSFCFVKFGKIIGKSPLEFTQQKIFPYHREDF